MPNCLLGLRGPVGGGHFKKFLATSGLSAFLGPSRGPLAGASGEAAPQKHAGPACPQGGPDLRGGWERLGPGWCFGRAGFRFSPGARLGPVRLPPAPRLAPFLPGPRAAPFPSGAPSSVASRGGTPLFAPPGLGLKTSPFWGRSRGAGGLFLPAPRARGPFSGCPGLASPDPPRGAFARAPRVSWPPGPPGSPPPPFSGGGLKPPGGRAPRPPAPLGGSWPLSRGAMRSPRPSSLPWRSPPALLV